MDVKDSVKVIEEYMKEVLSQNQESVHTSDSLRISYNAELGRYLTAARDIPAGELLLCETPVVIAPQAGAGPICLKCNTSLQSLYGSCENCGAPKCLDNCTNKYHSDKECRILERLQKKLWPIELVKIVNAVLTPLRAWITVEENKTIAPVICALQSNVELRLKLPIGRFIKSTIIPFINDRLNENVPEEFIRHSFGIFDTNAFKFDYCSSQGRALLPLAAMMMHDCIPNTDHWFTAEGKFIVRATCPILNGSAITNNYTNCLLGTQSRLKHLLITKLFTCTCKRCKDPTELGTHISSLRCRSCKKGLLVPPEAGNGERVHEIINMEWQCQECQTKLSDEMASTIARAGSFATELSDPDEMVERLQDLERMVGLQHYGALQTLMAFWKSTTTQSAEVLSSGQLRDVVAATELLLPVAERIAPGLTLYRGELLLGNLKARAELRQRRLEVGGSLLLKADVPDGQQILLDRLELCRAIHQHHSLDEKVVALTKKMNSILDN